MAAKSFEAFVAELRDGWAPPLPALIAVRRVDSTNDLARRLIDGQLGRSSPVAPCAVVAWEQSRGRGRQGRSWSSPPGGGAWVTMTTPLDGDDDPGALPLLLAVAVCRTLRRLPIPGCGLKWPNDVMVGERKLGGLLVEGLSTGMRPRAAVLGFGVNYRDPGSSGSRVGPRGGGEAPASAAAVLDEVAAPPSLAALVRRLVGEVTGELRRGVSARPELVEEYRRLSRHRPGERLRCRLPSGEIAGEFRGFDARGFLRLLVAGEERRISSAEIVED